MRTALLVLAALALAAPARAVEDLDGTQWKLKYEDSSGPMVTARTDYLMFDGGKMASARMVPRGFEPAKYADKKSGAAVEWRSEQTNRADNRLDWKGRRSGDTMEGTVTRTDADGKTREYRWKAVLNHPGD